MKLRVARHTTDLPRLVQFYTEILGLEMLGNFTGHDGYDGVFLGLPGADWHLEFTTSADAPVHQPDEDDLLVCYPATADEYQQLKLSFERNGAPEVPAKNPYWAINGATYEDPDGYRIVIVKQ